MRKSRHSAFAAILVIVLVLLFVLVERMPTAPGEVATSRKAPELIAKCILVHNDGNFKVLASGGFEVTVLNGRGAPLSHFLIERAQGTTWVELRRPPIRGTLVRWKGCL